MHEDGIVEAMAHLIALLVAERNSPPDGDGWIRTTNTAYRPAKTTEAVVDPKTETHAKNSTYWTPEKRAEASAFAKKAWTPERRQRQSEEMRGNKKGFRDGRGKNHPGVIQCSRCGKEGQNIRTCLSVDGNQHHREPIPWDPSFQRHNW